MKRSERRRPGRLPGTSFPAVIWWIGLALVSTFVLAAVAMVICQALSTWYG